MLGVWQERKRVKPLQREEEADVSFQRHALADCVAHNLSPFWQPKNDRMANSPNVWDALRAIGDTLLDKENIRLAFLKISYGLGVPDLPIVHSILKLLFWLTEIHILIFTWKRIYLREEIQILHQFGQNRCEFGYKSVIRQVRDD